MILVLLFMSETHEINHLKSHEMSPQVCRVSSRPIFYFFAALAEGEGVLEKETVTYLLDLSTVFKSIVCHVDGSQE